MHALAFFHLNYIYLVGMASQGVVHVHCFHKYAQNVHFGAMSRKNFALRARTHQPTSTKSPQNVHFGAISCNFQRCACR